MSSSNRTMPYKMNATQETNGVRLEHFVDVLATGFSGNGITFGTLSAMMICDALKGRKNPWRELFDPQRTQVRDRNGHRANGVNAVAEYHWLSRLCV